MFPRASAEFLFRGRNIKVNRDLGESEVARDLLEDMTGRKGGKAILFPVCQRGVLRQRHGRK